MWQNVLRQNLWSDSQTQTEQKVQVEIALFFPSSFIEFPIPNSRILHVIYWHTSFTISISQNRFKPFCSQYWLLTKFFFMQKNWLCFSCEPMFRAKYFIEWLTDRNGTKNTSWDSVIFPFYLIKLHIHNKTIILIGYRHKFVFV